MTAIFFKLLGKYSTYTVQLNLELYLKYGEPISFIDIINELNNGEIPIEIINYLIRIFEPKYVIN